MGSTGWHRFVLKLCCLLEWNCCSKCQLKCFLDNVWFPGCRSGRVPVFGWERGWNSREDHHSQSSEWVLPYEKQLHIKKKQKKTSVLNYIQTPRMWLLFVFSLSYKLFLFIKKTQKPLLSSPVNGGYSNWKEWGPCSRTCGQGFQERIRLCNNPEPANGGRSCSGPTIDSRKCHVGLCPGKTVWLSICVC